ncbi:MAG: ATP-grasp domain-containing protein [Pirellulales bacterium]|nr:ATP-grasp domain-containing protein [Pirellulales bacterium]
MKVAVVWNSAMSQVLNRFGQVCPEKYGRAAVERVVEGLREGGHEVALLEGDIRLLDQLRCLFPPGIDGTAPAGMVFNLAYGIQGACRYTHIPSILEMAGIPYTGSSPMGHTLALDKVVTKSLIREAGVPTPQWIVSDRPDSPPRGLRFPLVVKPRHESTSFGLRIVHDQKQLEEAVLAVLTKYDQKALVEEFIEGREVCIGLLGNEPITCLPIVELDFGQRELMAFTWEDKMHQRPDEPQKHCPADLPEHRVAELNDIARATFQACHCQDYARVDIRIDHSGNPQVLEINSMASLGATASYVLAATRYGYSFSQLVCRILDVAHQRYFGVPAPREMSPRPQSPEPVLFAISSHSPAPQQLHEESITMKPL